MSNLIHGFTPANLEYAKLIYACMCDDWWREHTLTDAGHRVTSRMYGNLLHDIKGLRSGYMSVKALQAVLDGKVGGVSKLTDEHYRARQTSGQAIIQYFLDHSDSSFEEFAMYLQRLCSVHKVLREENTRLKKYQNQGWHWTEEYEMAGVELIKIGVEKGKNWTRAALEQHRNDKPTPLKLVDEELATLYGN